MRIALALSGLPRLYPISASSWGRIIGKHAADVYIHTWMQDPITDESMVHQLAWSFSPVDLRIDPMPEIDVSAYPDRHWPCIDVYRSISMWHGINRAHGMIIGSQDYDIIMRGRLDWFVRSLEIIPFNGVVIPYDSDKIPLRFVYRDTDMHGLNDHFAYGPPKYMDAYARTLEEIPILYSEEMVDYCPENFLAASLAKQGIPVLLQHMEHKLIRG